MKIPKNLEKKKFQISKKKKIPKKLENIRLTLKHIKNLCTCVTNLI